MSTSIFRLTELPIEILERILLHLPAQDIIKMEVISRQFQGLTRDSPTLQYQRDLFSAGLTENPSNSCDFSQRRKLCKEHEHKWSSAGRVTKTIHELPEEIISEGSLIAILDRNLIASPGRWDDSLGLLRVPPVTSRKPIEWWKIPPLPFNPKAFAAYPPDNILAVAEEKERFICIHLLNLSDGSPYCAPPLNVIMWPLPQWVHYAPVEALAITSSRVMLHVCCSEVDKITWRAFVWDWKTGDLVLELPPTRGGVLVGENTGVFFLDEFRVVVSIPNYPDVPEFTLFNTLIPCGDPPNSRRFRVSPRYRSWWLSAHVDSDRCLGTLDQHKPHITDPAQAILVVDLVSNDERVLIIVQIQTLMEHLFSTSAEACVPWDEWRAGAVVMKVLHPGSGSTCSSPLVQGVRVTLVKTHITPAIDGNHFDLYLCTFDFSRRGFSALPLLDEGDGAERRALFEDGLDIWIQGHDEVTGWKFNSLCDSNFMCLDKSSASGSVLHVWELV